MLSIANRQIITYREYVNVAITTYVASSLVHEWMTRSINKSQLISGERYVPNSVLSLKTWGPCIVA